MQRNERGRFIKDGMSIQLPAPISILKYPLLMILFYPWFYIISNFKILDRIKSYIIPTTVISITNTPDRPPPPVYRPEPLNVFNLKKLFDSANTTNNESETLEKLEKMFGYYK